MEFKENAAVESAERRLLFNQIGWLNKSKFEEYLALNIEVQPYLNSVDDANNSFNNRIFVGKSIPSSEDNETRLEIIGTVFKKFETGEWVLNVSHGSGVHQIKSDFLVLNIQESETFFWVKTSKNLIPKYALRAAIDEYSKEYFYVGRVCSCFDSKPKYYRNGFVEFNESVSSLFGKVHVTHNCMYAPQNDLELIFNDYEILCMRPTPNKLKVIAREIVRKLTNYSNEKIELINKNSNGFVYVPQKLISFIKYPSYLTTGEYMLRNEKIVRDDGRFELAVLNNGDLVIRSVINNNESAKLNIQELNNLQDTQYQRIIYRSVNSIWLHKFHAIVYNSDWRNQKRVFILKSFPLSSETTDYRLMIDSNDTPNLLVFNDVNSERLQLTHSNINDTFLDGAYPLSFTLY